VRDGKESGGKGLFVKKANKAQEAALRNLQEQDEIFAAKAKLAKPEWAVEIKVSAVCK